MSRDGRMYLEDIVQSCWKIIRFTEGFSQADLLRGRPGLALLKIKAVDRVPIVVTEKIPFRLPHLRHWFRDWILCH